MDIVYSSDDNYARHVGISITSLYDHNTDVEDLNIYLIDDGISETNRTKLDAVAQKYGRAIHYIPFEPHKKKLTLNNKWELPISTYARLFVQEMLPKTVGRLIYLDCDTVVTDSLSALWDTDLQGNTIGAVEDIASCLFWKETGVPQQFRYFCAGILLIDMVKWRKTDAQQRLMAYLASQNGAVAHHDQTMLNGVFWNDCLMLHPRYDALTPTFIMSYNNLKAHFGLWDNYYSQKEIKESVKSPAIIHYTSSHIGRPWENNAHPKAKIYQRYWKASAWKDAPWGTFKSTYNPQQRRVYWLYQHVPVSLIRLISRLGGKGT